MAQHKLVFLRPDSPHIGERCPVRHTPFQPGDPIIVCQPPGRGETIVSLKSVSFLDGYCPICGDYVDISLAPVSEPDRPISKSPYPSKEKPSYSPPRRGVRIENLIVPVAIAIVVVVCLGSIVGFLLFKNLEADRRPEVEIVPTSTSMELPATQKPTSPPTQRATSTPAREATLATTQKPTSVSPVFERNNVGQSVRGRDLSMTTVGYEGKTAVVVVGSIQGDQETTRDLVDAVIRYFQQNPEQVPNNVAFYLIPTINPDGNASNSRYNANGVDLNRNWDTSDWKSNAAVPGYPNGKSGAGGSRSFSEPETRALRDFLQQLQSQSSRLRVMTLHASVHRSQGEVYPGGDQAMDIARSYASATQYDIEYAWAEYVTSGEAVTWCDEQGIPAIDVVIPASQGSSSQVHGSYTLLDVTIQALQDIANYR